MFVWILAAIMVAVSLATAGIISKHSTGESSELNRKTLHVVGAFGAIGLAFVLPLDQVAVLMALMSVVIGLSHTFSWPQQLYSNQRRSYGDVMLPLGALVAALWSPSLGVFVCAMAVVGVADSAAGLVGRQFGTRPIWLRHSRKTYLGSATFFVVAALVCAALLPVAWYAALLLATALTAVEYFAPLGSDNLLIPLTTVLAAQYLL